MDKHFLNIDTKSNNVFIHVLHRKKSNNMNIFRAIFLIVKDKYKKNASCK